MKFVRLRLASLLFLSALFFATFASTTAAAAVNADPADQGLKRLALVIGNCAYPSAPLRNPLNDARAIAAALRDIEFEVMEYEDAGLKSMEQAIRAFGRKLYDKGGVGLFYFAGHGLQVQGKNYLIPVDANIETESDVRYEAVDAGRILGKMEDAGNGLNLMILDACRDNPFARSFRSVEVGLAQMDAPTGTFIAYATKAGSKASDDSMFTQHLAQLIKVPGLSMYDILIKVRKKVMQETGGLQVPWLADSSTGLFYPAGKITGQTAALATVPVQGVSAPFAPGTIAEMQLGNTGWASPKTMYADKKGKVWLRKQNKLLRKPTPRANLFIIRSVSGYTVDVSKCHHRWERHEPDPQDIPVTEILNAPEFAARNQKQDPQSADIGSMNTGQQAWAPPTAMYADARGKLWLKHDQQLAAARTGPNNMRIERTADGFVVNISEVRHKWKRSGKARKADLAVVELRR